MTQAGLRDGPGRPSKLTDDTAARIVDLVRAGNYLKIAALAAGIGETTLHRWLADGAAAQTRADQDEPLTPDQEKYRAFRESITRAQAAAESGAVIAWRRAFTGDDPDWRAARDYLARTAPERWAGVTRVQMTTEETERRLDDAVTEALTMLGLGVLDDTDDDDLPRETDPDEEP